METNEKKVLLLIVEGKSDKTTFESSFNDLLRSKGLDENFICAVYYTDFTTHKYNEPDKLMDDSSDVVENIKSCLKSYLKSREN